jgi:hypothetical protein
MRACVLLCLCLLVLIPAVGASAQSSSQPMPTATVLGSTISRDGSRTLEVNGLQSGAATTVVLLDPQGGQTVLEGVSDSSGHLELNLATPNGAWDLGVYRVAVGIGDGSSISTTFAVSDGKPAVYAGPDEPSPTSAFVLTGTGLPADQSLHLILTLAGGFGDRSLQATTDATGTFSLFVWPQEYGYPFWSAGEYILAAPDLGISTPFWVREHPSASYLSIEGPAVPDVPESVGYAHYAAGRYLWTVYADETGRILGEFLLGPSDFRGTAQAAVRFPTLVSGTYLLATPYDWGETLFTVLAPTNTPTPAPTATARPTATATAPSSPTPRPTAKPTKRPTTKSTSRPKPTATRTPVRHPCKKHAKKRKLRCKR